MSTKNNIETLIRTLLVIALLCAVGIFAVLFFTDKNTSSAKTDETDDYVTFFDVGQGDCALIASNGKYCLVDTGTDASARVLCKSLKKLGIKNIDVLSLSHFHDDHLGGIDEVTQKFTVKNMILPPVFEDTYIEKDITKAKENLIKKDGKEYTADKGMNIKLGDFNITVLYQNTETNNENDRSVYLMAKYLDTKFLFTGDGESVSERRMLNKNMNLDCDVLKIAHHGGRGSTCDEFLSACSPDYGIISSETGNQYGHPHEETLKRLKNHGVAVYRTEQCGDITFNLDGDSIKITTEN